MDKGKKTKRFFKSLVLCTFFFVGVLCSFGQNPTVTEDDIIYTIDLEKQEAYVDNNKKVTKNNVTIQNEVEYNNVKYKVTRILDSAFSTNKNITGNLIIGENVEYIGKEAFIYCSGLNGTLTFKNKVKLSMGANAFDNCNFTGDLILPYGIEEIPEEAFYNVKFNGNLVIPNSVKIIGKNAFSLTRFSGIIVFPESVSEIKYWAFYGSNVIELTNMVLGTGLKKIGESGGSTFYGTKNPTGTYGGKPNITDIEIVSLASSAPATFYSKNYYGYYSYNFVGGSMSNPESNTTIKFFYPAQSIGYESNEWAFFRTRKTISNLSPLLLNYDHLYLKPGATRTLKVSTNYEEIVDGVEWVSLNPEVASVENGKITAHSEGVTAILVKKYMMGNSCLVASYCVINVSETGEDGEDGGNGGDNPGGNFDESRYTKLYLDQGESRDLNDFLEVFKVKAQVNSTGVSLNTTSSIVPINEPSRDDEEVEDEEEDETCFILWKSSNENIAQVSSQGICTAASFGTALITAYDENGEELGGIQIYVSPAINIEYSDGRIYKHHVVYNSFPTLYFEIPDDHEIVRVEHDGEDITEIVSSNNGVYSPTSPITADSTISVSLISTKDPADLNGDGVVNVVDMNILIERMLNY